MPEPIPSPQRLVMPWSFKIHFMLVHLFLVNQRFSTGPQWTWQVHWLVQQVHQVIVWVNPVQFIVSRGIGEEVVSLLWQYISKRRTANITFHSQKIQTQKFHGTALEGAKVLKSLTSDIGFSSKTIWFLKCQMATSCHQDFLPMRSQTCIFSIIGFEGTDTWLIAYTVTCIHKKKIYIDYICLYYLVPHAIHHIIYTQIVHTVYKPTGHSLWWAWEDAMLDLRLLRENLDLG